MTWRIVRSYETSELVSEAHACGMQVVVEGIGARLRRRRNAAAAVAKIEHRLVVELHVEIFAADDPVVGERIFSGSGDGTKAPTSSSASFLMRATARPPLA